MSKVKDLYAIENAIDDLMPTREPEKIEMYETLIKVIGDNDKDVRAEFREKAEFGYDEDEHGHSRAYIDNYLDICESISNGYAEDYVYQHQVNIDDNDFSWVVEKLQTYIADRYADYESELIEEMEGE